MSLHRRAAKRDENEAGIIDALRAVGCTVTPLSGTGVPDLLVGHRGTTLLLEVKMPRKGLTDAQAVFHASWKGAPIHIVTSADEALAALKEGA